MVRARSMRPSACSVSRSNSRGSVLRAALLRDSAAALRSSAAFSSSGDGSKSVMIPDRLNFGVFDMPSQWTLIAADCGLKLNPCGHAPVAPLRVRLGLRGHCSIALSIRIASGNLSYDSLDGLSVAQHGPQRVGCQNTDAAVGSFQVAHRFEFAQDCTRGGPGDVRHESDVFLSQVDLDRQRVRWGGQSTAAQAQQDRDASLDVIADHQVVVGPDGHIKMADRYEGEKSPGHGIVVDDFTNPMQGKVQQFAVACCRESDPPRLTSESGCFSKPGPWPRDMCEVWSALIRRDRYVEAAGYQTKHAAWRVADRINRLPRFEVPQLASVKDAALEPRRRLAEPAMPQDDFTHGSYVQRLSSN